MVFGRGGGTGWWGFVGIFCSCFIIVFVRFVIRRLNDGAVIFVIIFCFIFFGRFGVCSSVRCFCCGFIGFSFVRFFSVWGGFFIV